IRVSNPWRNSVDRSVTPVTSTAFANSSSSIVTVVRITASACASKRALIDVLNDATRYGIIPVFRPTSLTQRLSDHPTHRALANQVSVPFGARWAPHSRFAPEGPALPGAEGRYRTRRFGPLTRPSQPASPA